MFHVKHISVQSCQNEKLTAYAKLLQKYNQRINLLSRRTVDLGFEEHIQECLAFADLQFSTHDVIVDWGTGGGLPAIPLAIIWPEVKIYAVDAAEKKILAVRAFKRALDLPNLYPWHGRAEKFTVPIHYSISRATTSLVNLWEWHSRVAPLDGGVLYCMKGGDITEEKKDLKVKYPQTEITEMPLQQKCRVVLRVKCPSVEHR